MTGDPSEVRVGDRVFRQRRLTGQARLEVIRAYNRVQDRFDVSLGLQMEMSHTERRLAALRDGEAFDVGVRDELLAERAAIRERMADANDAFHRARVELVHAQTDGPPPVEELLESLTVDDVDLILGVRDDQADDEGDVPPPVEDSTPVGESSS